METDSLLTTRAMGSPVRPEAVLDSFDEISYLKVRLKCTLIDINRKNTCNLK